MKTLFKAAVVVAGLGLMAGCQDNKSQTADARREVAEAEAAAAKKTAEANQELGQKTAEVRQDTAQETAKLNEDANKELAEAREGTQREVAAAREDVAEARKDMTEAEREAARDAQADARRTDDTAMETGTGGAGVMMATGALSTGMGSGFKVKDASGKELELDTDDRTRVLYNGQAVKLDDFKDGTQVRASYTKKGDDLVARDVTILKPVRE